MKRTILSVLLALTMLLALLSGCGSTAVPSAASAGPDSAAASAPEAAAPAAEHAAEPETASAEEAMASAVEEVPEEEEIPEVTISYPLEGDDLELSYFVSFPGNLATYMESFDVHPGFMAAQEATGVKINFNAPSMENAFTQFELMVAADDFEDIVGGFGDMYMGGAAAAYEGDLIYDIAPLIAENAPDYQRVIDGNDAYKAFAYEPDGTMLGVYGVYKYDVSSVTNGVFIRQDWLDDLNLDLPVTYDDWHETLTAFKNEKGAEAGLLLPMGSESRGATYAGGYQTIGYSSDARMSGGHFFQVDGKVTSSLIDDNYRDYLTMINSWYEEGLVYHDFYSNDTRDILDPLVYGNQVGIFDGKVDYITRFESGDPNGAIRLTGIANPVKNEGDKSGFGNYVEQKSSVSITTSCDNPELALQWLNYFFTEEGILLCNYGQEGVSFEYGPDGTPVFTDLILHNEDPWLQFGNVTRLYLLDEVLPTVYDQTRELSAYSEKEQEAIALWSDTKEAKYTMPSVTLTTEENEELYKLLADIETYASENVIRFIIGDLDLSEWDSFTSTMRDMGIERCIEIYQGALDAA